MSWLSDETPLPAIFQDGRQGEAAIDFFLDVVEEYVLAGSDTPEYALPLFSHRNCNSIVFFIV
jgi:hypothetical protein